MIVAAISYLFFSFWGATSAPSHGKPWLALPSRLSDDPAKTEKRRSLLGEAAGAWGCYPVDGQEAEGLMITIRWTRVAALLGCAALAAVAPHEADACSPPMPGIARTMAPASKATGVPRSAKVRLHYRATGSVALPANKVPRLLDAAGKELPTLVEEVLNAHERIFVLSPKSPLPAGAVITVKDWLGTTSNFCSQFGGANQCVDAEVTAGTFTVGTAIDEKAPTFAGLTGFKADWDACDNSACCGPYAGYRVKLAWQAATDDQGDKHVRYRVLRHTTSGKVTVGAWLQSAVGATSGGFLAGTANLGLLADGTYEVCAADQSGNETCGATSQQWTAPAPPGQADAGSTDAGSTDAGGTDSGSPPPDTGAVDATSDDGVADDGGGDGGGGDDGGGDVGGGDVGGGDDGGAPDDGGTPDTSAGADTGHAGPDADPSDTAADGGGAETGGTDGQAVLVDADSADAAAQPNTHGDDGGCTAGRRGTRGGPLWAMGFALLALAGRRRWRRVRTAAAR